MDRYCELVNPAHRDYQPGYIAVLHDMAKTTVAPAGITVDYGTTAPTAEPCCG